MAEIFVIDSAQLAGDGYIKWHRLTDAEIARLAEPAIKTITTQRDTLSARVCDLEREVAKLREGR